MGSPVILAPRSALMCVAPSLVEQVWPMVAEMVESSYLAMDLFTPDVLSWLKAEKGLLWIVVRNNEVIGCATTSLEPRPSGLSCRVVVGGGWDLQVYRNQVEPLKNYARREGCVKFVIQGRIGWARVLPGFTPTGVILETRL